LMTPLHLAVINNHADIARLLLAFGADVNVKMSTGETALELGLSNLLGSS
jgi:ankyrin repeat protein